MKIPLSLKIASVGVAADLLSKVLVTSLLFFVPISWHDATGPTFYSYTLFGLDNAVSRSDYLYTIVIGLAMLIGMIYVLEFRSKPVHFPRTNYALRISTGLMMVPTVQALVAMFYPVPNFIPAPSYALFIFYSDFWGWATIADYFRSFAIIAVVAAGVMYFAELAVYIRKRLSGQSN